MRHQTKFLFKISQQKRNDQDGSKINTHTHTHIKGSQQVDKNDEMCHKDLYLREQTYPTKSFLNTKKKSTQVMY